ncbi:TPA: riboflavin synthase [bacterium]|nr:riboflavin synthase [bacterium]
MFTGIIEEIGIIANIERSANSCKLIISAKKIIDDCKDGDSISVNGTCLTVTKRLAGGFVADVMAETMRRTNLDDLKTGDKVNLERSLRLSDRLGGHIVAGHVDEVGTVIELIPEGIATLMRIKVSSDLMRYVAVKGSVCIDGVSLTVTDVTDTSFQVSLIPYTKEITILGLKRLGDKVNIEADMLARYLERLMIAPNNEQKSAIDEEFLAKHGFM